MRRRIEYTLYVALATALMACSDSKSATCTDSSDCPSGNVCLTNRCEKLCNDSEPCPEGFFCQFDSMDSPDAGICLDSGGIPPEITQVAGNGDTSCVGDTGMACVASGFLVEGRFSPATSFQLVGPSDASNVVEYDLTVASINGAGSAAELVMNMTGMPSLAPGRYSLVATNQAGNDNSSIQLLQGAPGPDLTGSQMIERINQSSAGLIDASRLDLSGSGGSGGTLYLYDDSTTPTSNDEVGDRMWIRVAGKTDGSAASLAVDHTRFTALCGDGDGCDITLGAESYRATAGSSISLPFRNGGACKMFFNPVSGGWTVDDTCTVWRRRLNLDENNQLVDPGDDGDLQGFKPYVPSAYFGFDQSYADGADPVDEQSRVVIGYNFACYFAEAPAAGDGFDIDDDVGFHLVAAGGNWVDYPEDYFPVADTNRACVLIIED